MAQTILELLGMASGATPTPPPGDGKQSLTSYEPTMRDKLANWLLGETPSQTKKDFVQGLVGSRGMGATGMGLVDFTPAGVPMQSQEGYRERGLQGAAMPFIGGAGKVARQFGDATEHAIGQIGAALDAKAAYYVKHGKEFVVHASDSHPLMKFENEKAAQNYVDSYSGLSPQGQNTEKSFAKQDKSLWQPMGGEKPKQDLSVTEAKIKGALDIPVPPAPSDSEVLSDLMKNIHSKKAEAQTSAKVPPSIEMFSPKAVASYDKAHEDLTQNPLVITPGQNKAVSYWTDPTGYKDINGMLRGLPAKSTETPGHIEALDTAMQNNPLGQDTNSWRGLHGPHAEELSKLDVGDTFQNKGYTATTIDPRRATHYGAKDDGVIVNYHLPEGSPSLYTSHPDSGGWSQAERELLLPHGTSYQILKKEQVQAPVWDYTGKMTDETPHTYTVYHVAPAEMGQKAPKQLDKVPGLASQMTGGSAPVKAPVWGYEKDDNGTYHVFDAITGKTHGVVKNEQAAWDWIGKQKEGTNKAPPPTPGPAPFGDSMKDALKKMLGAPDLKAVEDRYQQAIAPLKINFPSRALEQGYETPAFRGMKIYGKDEPNPVYNFGGDNSYGQMYSSDNPMLADMYSDYKLHHPGWDVKAGDFGEGAQVSPLLLNTKDYHYYDAQGGDWRKHNSRAMDEARKLGKPGVIVDNVRDEPNSTENLPSPSKVFITFPSGASTAKSRFAERFDPTSPNMLHGIPVGAMIGSGLIMGQDGRLHKIEHMPEGYDPFAKQNPENGT